VAFVIIFSLMFFMTSCFGGNTPTTNTPNNPPEQPHVCVFGAWETIKEATNTEDGLRERRCECGEVEQEVIKSSNTEYYIQYRNVKSVYPEEYGYNSSEGLILPWIEEEGYRFLGWYTELIGGDFIDEIPAGSNQNYILYAHWELETYTITFKRYETDPDETNQRTYTVETPTFKLPDSYWTGLSFAYWTKDGDVITQIDQGTTGNITLVANWRYKENLSVSSNKKTPIMLFDELEGRYYFVYELGVIDTVVLETVKTHEKDYDNNGEPLNWTTSESSSIEENIAKTVATTVGQNLSKTTEWENARQWAEDESNTENWSMSVEGSFSYLELIGFKISGSDGGSTTKEISFSGSTVNGNAENEEHKNESTFESHVSYVQNSTLSVTENFSVSATMPMGVYKYAYVGTVKVYIIVTYDPDAMDYHIDTYTSIENVYRSTTLYEPSGNMINKVNIVENEPLIYDVKRLIDLQTFINSSWYNIEYDANGGEGEMPTATFYSGIDQSLNPNCFTKEGYTFVGWQYQNDTSGAVIKDKQIVCDLAKGGETIVLQAVWAANPYTVTFDVAGGNALSPATHSVTFNEKYGEDGSLPTPIRTGYVFAGWYNGNDPIDNDSVVITASNHTLTAKWNPIYYTILFDGTGGTVSSSNIDVTYGTKYGELPVAERYGYNFDGWFTEIIDGVQVCEDSIVELLEDEIVTLYAHWTPKTCRLNIQALDFGWTYNVNYGDTFTFDLNAQYGFPNSSFTFQAWFYAEPHDTYIGLNSQEGLLSLITTSTTFTITINESTPLYDNIQDTDCSIYIVAYMTGAKGTTNPLCITGDTLVTLSDATQVRVDELTGDEMLLVWNLETGRYEAAPIVFVDSEDETECEIVHLYFSDGSDVKVIYEHGFFDIDLGKYVYIDASNYADYIGHRFVKQGDIESDTWNEVTLDRVVIETKVTTAWSPVTSEHLCYYTNGILSMPGGIDGLFNIFEVDTDTMTYDAEKMAKDIETYGLYTYEDYEGLIPEEAFVAFNGDWLKVAIGKGMLNWEDIERLVERYIPLM